MKKIAYSQTAGIQFSEYYTPMDGQELEITEKEWEEYHTIRQKFERLHSKLLEKLTTLEWDFCKNCGSGFIRKKKEIIKKRTRKDLPTHTGTYSNNIFTTAQFSIRL